MSNVKKGKPAGRRYIPIPERANERSKSIAKMSIFQILCLMASEDYLINAAIRRSLAIAKGVERPLLDPMRKVIYAAIRRLAAGGRLIYIGAGNSGRMGIIDACSIPSNFGVEGMVLAVIAGAPEAPTRKFAQPSVDDPQGGGEALREIGLTKKDTVIGLSISGSTPFTIGGLEYANSLGCKTACITCDPGSPITKSAEICIEVDVGPEVITGSTRLKSSTALKMLLNMISTAVMVKLQYTSGNSMSHVIPKDRKRTDRALDVIMCEIHCRRERAEEWLHKGRNDPRVAIVMAKGDVKYPTAEKLLEANRNSVHKALKALKRAKVKKT